MRVLNAVQRVLLMLVLIPVIAICLDTLLRAFGAQGSNPIVAAIRDVANFFIIEPFKTVFPNQTYWQDALVALAAFGVLALVIRFIFRGLRAMVGTRPPTVRTSAQPAGTPAPKAAPAPPKAEAATAAEASTGDDTTSTSP